MSQLMDEGRYWAQLQSAMVAEGKNAPYVNLECRVTHIAGDGAWIDLPEEVVRNVVLSLSNNAWDYTEKKLLDLGFNGNFEAMEFSKIASEGGLQLNCTHEVYNGQTREKWDLPGGERKKADADTVRALTGRWKTNHQQAAPPVARPAAPRQAPAPVPASPVEGDDDIPF